MNLDSNHPQPKRRSSLLARWIAALLRFGLGSAEIRAAVIDSLMDELLEDPRVRARIELLSGGILGGEELLRVIAAGDIDIDPLWDPEHNPEDRNRPCPLDNECYDFRIGTRFTRPKRGITVHMTNDEIAEVLEKGEHEEVPVGTEVVVRAGEGIIYHLHERIRLGARYCCRLSTLSRGGRAFWLPIPGADVLHPFQNNQPTGEGINLNLIYQGADGVERPGNDLVFIAGVTDVVQGTFSRTIGMNNGRVGRFSKQTRHIGGTLNGSPRPDGPLSRTLVLEGESS